MGNFSREDTFNKLKHYVGVRLQQGVPLVDADWNEQEDIRKHELRTFLKWFVGNGVPQGNNGFRITQIAGGGEGTIVLTSDKETIGLSSIVIDLETSTAAQALGFGPDIYSASRSGSSPARLVGNLSEPFTLEQGMKLVVSTDGLDKEEVTFQASDFVKISEAEAEEVVAAINSTVENFTASVGQGNDFIIKGGTKNEPGRCLVDGWDVIIEDDIKYTEQPLYNNDALALDWKVESLAPLSPTSTGELKDMVYLDVWEREVDSEEDKELMHSAINIETCVRLKREWVVRVAQGLDEKTGLDQYLEKHNIILPGHVYYEIAQINREAGKNTISEPDIMDVRQTCLSLPDIKEYIDADRTITSAKIREADSTSGQDTSQGDGIKTNHIQDKAVITGKLADIAVTNAKLRNGCVNEDKLSTAIRGKLVTNGNNHDHSGGAGAQIMHSSLNKNDGTNPHGTTAEDVEALPITGGDLNGDLTVNGNVGIGTTQPTVKLEVNGEVKANNLTAMENDFQQILTDAFGSSYTLGHDGKTNLTLNMREVINAILRGILSGTRPITPPHLLTNNAKGDQKPFALLDRNDTIWVFWHTTLFSSNSIYCKRFINGTWYGREDWEPLINGPGNDECPFALEDQNGTIWVFWQSDRYGSDRIYFKCCIDGTWQDDMRLSIGNVDSESHESPFVLEDQNGTIWVFWISYTDKIYEIKYRKHLSGAKYDDWQNEEIVTSGLLTISPNIYAVEHGKGNIWVFWELPGIYEISIYYRRYINGSWVEIEDGEMLTPYEYSDSWPFALTDSSGVTWLFWTSFRAGGKNIYYRRYLAGNWQNIGYLTTGTLNDESPFALEDINGDIWVFWRSNRTGNWDIWYNRHVNNNWIGNRQLTKGVSVDSRPFALTDNSGNIWVFWHSGDNIGYSLFIIQI